MATSQNGWSVIGSGDVAPLVVRGVAYAPGVRRSLLPLFADFCHRLADIEAPHDGWCWGFASRPIRGKTAGFSNHASGTAIDHNAPHHGRGGPRYAGFSNAQVKAIHALLERYDGVIRWGGDYKLPPYDPMHFEISGSSADVNRVLKQLQVQAVPKEELSMAEVQAILDKLENVETKVEKTYNHVSERTGAVYNEAHAARAEVAELRKLFEAFLLRQGENPSGKLP